MKPGSCLPRAYLTEPRTLLELSLSRWDLLVRQAARAGLLARIGALLGEQGLLAEVPPQPRRHLENTLKVARRQQEVVGWELRRIHDALAPTGVPVVVLKGAAYVIAGLPAARGRMFWDIDILVPGSALDDVERALGRVGWVPEAMDDYDQRYYRQWMHELPPLKHVKRKTVLDVHHTILPPTARLHPDPAKLLRDARPVEGFDELYVLSPEDMVLHSATHLFHDGELEHGLRDLLDLWDLIGHFAAADAGYWERLVERARVMDLQPPLHYALRYLERVLGMEVPAPASAALRRSGPPAWRCPAMDALFLRALQPDHRSCADRLTGIARWLLYVRSHHLRMPLRLLVPHLARKAWMRRTADE